MPLPLLLPLLIPSLYFTVVAAKRQKVHNCRFGSPVSAEAESCFIQGTDGLTLKDGVASAQHPSLANTGADMLGKCATAFGNFSWFTFQNGAKYMKWSLDINLLTKYIKDKTLFSIYSAAKYTLGCYKVVLLIYDQGAGILQHTDAVPAGCCRFMIKHSQNGQKTVPLHFGHGTDVLFTLSGTDGVVHGVASHVNSTGHYNRSVDGATRSTVLKHFNQVSGSKDTRFGGNTTGVLQATIVFDVELLEGETAEECAVRVMDAIGESTSKVPADMEGAAIPVPKSVACMSMNGPSVAC